MRELVPVLTKDQIEEIVEGLAQKISSAYQGCDLVLIGILKGAFIFLADLIRKLTIPAQLDFIRVASYGIGTSSSGKIQLSKPVEIDLKDKDVLIVEDIVDTGLTLAYLVDYLKSFGAKTVNICALIDKQERREKSIEIKYTGYVVEKGFLIGYGLDCAEDYRGLPGIFDLKL